MAKKTLSARDLSYAWSAQTKGGKAMIRLMENSTGRLRLIKRAKGYEDLVGEEAGFFEVMTQRYGLTLDVVAGSLDHIPKTGPLIMIANHPYGILDGMMLGQMLSQTRDDFRIMAHQVFNRAPDLNAHLLPVSFDETKEALTLNLATRKTALRYLGEGGAIGVFPGGTVSTGSKLFSPPLDPKWRSFTARMIAKSDAVVVPVYFHGHTSRMFQIASHLHSTLRMGLLIKEFRKRVDTPVRVSIGAPIGRDQLAPLAGDGKAMMDFLRKATYEMAPNPASRQMLGHEFDKRHKVGR